MLLAGLAWVVCTEIYCAVMQRSFQDTNNKVGKSFAILGIYLFAVGYCRSLRYMAVSSSKAKTS